MGTTSVARYGALGVAFTTTVTLCAMALQPVVAPSWTPPPSRSAEPGHTQELQAVRQVRALAVSESPAATLVPDDGIPQVAPVEPEVPSATDAVEAVGAQHATSITEARESDTETAATDAAQQPTTPTTEAIPSAMQTEPTTSTPDTGKPTAKQPADTGPNPERPRGGQREGGDGQPRK